MILNPFWVICMNSTIHVIIKWNVLFLSVYKYQRFKTIYLQRHILKYLQSISLFVRYKMHAIHTVRKCVTCHPLLNNLPSLGRYHGYFLDTTDIKLYPLVMVIVPGCPASHEPTTAHAFESSKEWCMVAVPHGWCNNLIVFDATALDAKWIAAKSCQFCDKKNSPLVFRL